MGIVLWRMNVTLVRMNYQKANVLTRSDHVVITVIVHGCMISAVGVRKSLVKQTRVYD